MPNQSFRKTGADLQGLLDETEEREITLGVGKLVGLFFLLVILCAVCFAVGYGFGRNSAKPPTPCRGGSGGGHPNGRQAGGEIGGRRASRR